MTKRTRRLLLICVGIPGGIIGILVVSFVVLYVCSGDLEPVRSRARAQGVPLQWSETNWRENPGHAKLDQELESMANTLVFTKETHQFGSWVREKATIGGATFVLADSRDPVPQSIVDVYGIHDPPILEQVDSWLAALSGQPLMSSPEPEFWNFDQLKRTREVIHWLQWRALCREDEHPRDILRILDCIDAITIDGYSAYSLRSSLLKGCTHILARRLAESHGGNALVTNRLRFLAEKEPKLLQPTLEGQFIRLNQCIERDPIDWAKDSGTALPGYLTERPILSLYYRLGKAGLLQRQTELLREIRAGNQPMPLEGPIHMRSTTWASAPSDVLASTLYEYFCVQRLFLVKNARMAFELQVLAALWAGEPMPVEPIGGASLILHTDGDLVIGISSRGPDGVDNQGGLDDWRVPAYLPRSAPSFREFPVIVPAAPSPSPASHPIP